MRMLITRARCGLFTLLVGLAPSLPSTAAEVLVSFRYRGEPSGQFISISPPASFCSQWKSYCNRTYTADLPITYTKAVIGHAADKADGFTVQTPSRRAIAVFDPDSGNRSFVTFEIDYVSQRVHAPQSANPVNTRDVSGGCRYLDTLVTNPWTQFLWRVNSSQGNSPLCHAANENAEAGETLISDVDTMGIGFRAFLDRPTDMKAGFYRGSTTFLVGPGGNFNFGNGVTNLNDTTLTVNFELEVRHDFAFNFVFPAGTDRVLLEPPGGWAGSAARGRAPSRLYRSLPFQMSSAVPFKAYKTCQYPVGDSCGIRSDDGHEVPVSVALTLPYGIREQGKLVQKRELPSGKAAALALQVDTPMASQTGQLHFEVGREDTAQMAKHPGQTYRGDVTVVFDTQL